MPIGSGQFTPLDGQNFHYTFLGKSCRPSANSRSQNPLRLLGRNLQIGKVALRARADPQCDSSGLWIELEIIDDQAGLLRSVHVEACFAAFDLDLVLGPYTGLQIDVRLVLFGSLLPRPCEVKI